MNDRELLEMAAKAAGIDVRGRYEDEDTLLVRLAPGRPKSRWNPLTDDGDALRLAVKLLLSMEHDAAYQPHQEHNTKVRVLCVHQQLLVGMGEPGTWQKEFHDADPYAATRRAIVRAAAEIGRTPPTPKD